jgi:predicted RNase H-like HicB family nuclease
MVTKKKTKDIAYYLNLPWTYTIETDIEDEKRVYVVHVNELPGVATDAPTIEKAMILIKDAMEGVFEMYLENGEEIPEPTQLEQFKGNIAYRTSSIRHYQLTKEAQKTNQSLSQFIDHCIDTALQKLKSGNDKRR